VSEIARHDMNTVMGLTERVQFVSHFKKVQKITKTENITATGK